MEDQNKLITHLVAQLEDAVRINQETIDKLKNQMATPAESVDIGMECKYALDYMASCQRTMFTKYSSSLSDIKAHYAKNSSIDKEELAFWKEKYQLEKLKTKKFEELCLKVIDSCQKECEDYGTIINMYQTYTDNLIEHCNQESNM